MSVRQTPFVIAIDGPVAAGKDTVAKLVAKQLGTIHVNSGALYRMWTYLTLKHHKALDELEEQVDTLIEKHHFRLELRDDTVRYLLDDEDITDHLYENNISTQVAHVSKITAIRKHANEVIRQFAGRSSLVIDGRDATTIIFPDADLKVYLDTDFSVRVQRRLSQVQIKDPAMTYELLASQMKDRDDQDRDKGIYSLGIAENAFYLDATHLTPEEAASSIVLEFTNRTGGRDISASYS